MFGGEFVVPDTFPGSKFSIEFRAGNRRFEQNFSAALRPAGRTREPKTRLKGGVSPRDFEGLWSGIKERFAAHDTKCHRPSPVLGLGNAVEIPAFGQQPFDASHREVEMFVVDVGEKTRQVLLVENTEAHLFTDNPNADLLVRTDFGESFGQRLGASVDDVSMKCWLSQAAFFIVLGFDFDRPENMC